MARFVAGPGGDPTIEQKAAAGRLTRDFSSDDTAERFVENTRTVSPDVSAGGTVERTRVTGGTTSFNVGQIPDNVQQSTTEAARRQATGGDLEGQGTFSNFPELPQTPGIPDLRGLLAVVLLAIVSLFLLGNVAEGVGQGLAGD